MLPKLMFLGNEGCGKTSMIEGLKVVNTSKDLKDSLKSFRNSIFPTEGVVNGTLNVSGSSVNYWDYSGKLKYLSSYPIFLTERSIYVIAYNINAKLDLCLKLWVQTVQFYAPRSKIVFVATHLDSIKKSKRPARLLLLQEEVKEYLMSIDCNMKKVAGIFAVNNRNGNGIKEFMKALTTIVSSKEYLEEVIPPEYFVLNKEILKNKCRQPPLLHWNELVDISKEHCKSLGESQVTEAVKFLETIGSVLYFPGIEDKKKRIKSPLYLAQNNNKALESDVFSNRDSFGFVIVDPIFISKIFSAIHSQQFKTEKGIGLVSSLTNIFKTELHVPVHLHEKLLVLLEFFDVIFRLSDGNLVMVPERLESSVPNFQRDWPTWDPTVIQLNRDYAFDFFPHGLFSRFSLRMLQHFGSDVCPFFLGYSLSLITFVLLILISF